MAVTSKEIAELCGVSQGTVDRALNDRPGISPATKKKILDTAARLGYRPHLLARSLVKGSTMTLGLVVFDLYNRFFAQLVNAIETHAKKAGYFVYLTLTDKSIEEERDCIEHLADRQIDGLLLCSVNKGQEYEEYLKRLKIPVTTIGNRVSPQFPFVGIDDFAAMRDAAAHLIGKGYSRILYICTPLSKKESVNLYAQEQRLAGCLDAVGDAGGRIELQVIDKGDYLARVDTLMADRSKKTAALCSSDIFALELLKHCRAKGLQVPGALGIMGFDNIDVLKYVQPSPSTVSYPLEELGEKAVRCLIRQINEGEGCGDVYLKHRIIEGDSL